MADIIINNIRFQDARSIKIINNRIYIDGDEVTPDAKNINISVEGNIAELDIDSCGALTINGNVDTIRAGSADIDIDGDVIVVTTASGEIDIRGSVNKSVTSASGDIEVRGHVYGNVSTMSGDIDCECDH